MVVMILCITYSTYMEHRCDRCISYSIALAYVLLSVFPIMFSLVGIIIGFKNRVLSNVGLYLNSVSLALLMLGGALIWGSTYV